MPRRRALRTIAAALAMGAFEALRPRRAAGYAGSPSGCPQLDCGRPNEKLCCVPVGKYGGYHSTGCCGEPGREDCCIGPNDDEAHPNPMSWCCPKGSCGASGAKCLEKRTCKSDEVECGKTCCGPGQFCASPLRSICCNAGENVCVVPRGGAAVCCKPGTKCCFNMTSAKCCDNATETCVKGKCTCNNPKLKCGTDCCAKAGLCCVMAAGNRCCKPDEFCATILGAPGNKNCCPKDRVVVTKSGAPVCCPSGSVDNGRGACCPPDNLDCCGTGDLGLLCSKGMMCSLGQCVAI
jgi:hypothetical protein